MAFNTCDGSVEPELHAEPVEAHIFCLSSFNNNSSPSILGNEILIFPGSLFFKSPFIFISLYLVVISFIKLFLNYNNLQL